MILVNSFSLNMLAGSVLASGANIVIKPCSRECVRTMAPFDSRIGHSDTAILVGSDLGLQVAHQRGDIALLPGESVVVAQYIGPRLPEGSTRLPVAAEIRYFLVTVAAIAAAT